MKRIRQHRSILLAMALLVGVAVTLIAAPEALAQFGEETKSPPTPGSMGKPPLLLQYGVLVVLVLGVLGLSIFRSKREIRKS
jgi:hypothetical protein